MKKLLCLVAILAAFASSAQVGVGIRLGDPSGVTIKKYFSDNALEFSIGRTHFFDRSDWYGNHFNKWYEKQHFGYNSYEYVGYRGTVPLGMQLHYLFHRSITSVANESTSGLDWYYGLGGQLRFQNYYYDYRYKVAGDPNWHYARDERVTDIDLGADLVIGLEYRFPSVPISVFGDLTLFMEIVDDPFLFWFQGGLGVRYNF
jgi:hypothetical protein